MRSYERDFNDGQKKPTDAEIRATFMAHPLPWHVVEDWSYEVVAADGAIVFQRMFAESAQAIVDRAKEL